MKTLFLAALALLTAALFGMTEHTASKSTTELQGQADRVKPPCDFQASFMTWDLPPYKDPRPHARHNIPLGNKARIQVDAIIDVIKEEGGASERFVLIAPCRTEWVYAKDRLFQLPSSEFRCIYSLKQERSMWRSLTFQGKPQRGHPVTDQFRSVAIDIRGFAGTRVLKTAAEICAATERNVPLVGRTEIRDPKRKERYVLEYPIRTMNFRPETPSFQIDTGPLLVPDFAAGDLPTIDRLEMAHIACNVLDRAEFILRRPTPITGKDGNELARVLHYSEVRELPARTLILTGEGR